MKQAILPFKTHQIFFIKLIGANPRGNVILSGPFLAG
jgi:hypothetical protein